MRTCLLGIPGAGKTACIKWAKRFFNEALGWESGMQYQCLASQNTMAALIGGQTIHSWGRIPINATDANDKMHKNNKDGDIDELYVSCLCMRWLIIDEVSTVSPQLLGILDTFLRRACKRHPYASRRDGSHRPARPFGGLNIVFCGDFWQLPPVRSHAIFSNPFKRAVYDVQEQKILNIFWRSGPPKDSVQSIFTLHQPMRSKDDDGS